MMNNTLLNNIKNCIPFVERNVLHNLFSWNELESLLNLRPFVNSARLHILSNVEYKWSSSIWLTDINTYPPNLLNEEIKKYVCYIQDCSRVNKNINDICSILENHCKWPADAHIFFSYKEAHTDLTGFGIHKDEQPNLITCVDGKIQAKIWSENKNGEPVIDTILNKGDVVYIPNNVYHQIIPLTKRISISFPMNINHTLTQERDWIKT
jgi:hypothetical protein